MQEECEPYRYFDTPDGEDIDKKLWVVLKPTITTALGFSIADNMLNSHPQGYRNILKRGAYVTLPIIGISTAFVLTTNLAAKIRGKDDKLNWFLGGFAAGTVLRAWSKKKMFIFNMGSFFGILAIMRKTAADNCWEIHPTKTPIANGGVWSVNLDWSLMEERPRNWVKCKEDAKK